MEKLFEDKTVFITGGATGIERACAIAFAAQEVDGGNQTYPAAEYPSAIFDDMIDVNVRGMFCSMKHEPLRWWRKTMSPW